MTPECDKQLDNLTAKVKDAEILSAHEVALVGQALTSEEVSVKSKQEFLLKWEARGEQPSEVASLACYFREQARDPDLHSLAPHSIDIVGTGGDRAGTFNISTVTAFIVASGGVPVIKHGNRSITSKTGGADLIESLGIPLDSNNEQLRRSLEENNFCFLFAPAFHPAFKAIMPVRKALAEAGKKTVFNILGPLINPARPAFQMLGVFSASWVTPLAAVLTQNQIKRGLVIHSSPEGQAMDELTTLGENLMAAAGSVAQAELEEIQACIASHAGGSLADLKGGDALANRETLFEVFEGRGNPVLVNTLCLNAAVAFRLVGKVSSVEEGFEFASSLLVSGEVKAWTKRVQKNV